MSNRPDYRIVLQADHIKRLEEEIKQLKEEKQKTTQDAISKLCVEKSVLYNELDKLELENTKYKQTLDEIKEIANYLFNRSTSEYIAKLELIIDKISEVKND